MMSGKSRRAYGITVVVFALLTGVGCSSSNTASAPSTNLTPQVVSAPIGENNQSSVPQSTMELSDIPEAFSPDQAAAAGFFVEANGMVYNQQVADDFFTNVNAGQPAAMRVVRYTTEGDPVFADYAFDGQQFTVTYDESRDRNIAQEDKVISVVPFSNILPLDRNHVPDDPMSYVLSNTDQIYTDATGTATVEGLGWLPTPSLGIMD